MKFNWGTGIFIFYTLFALSLFYQVYKSTQYDHSLVVDNYYEKDLAYQSQFEKIENSLHLEPGLIINHFPKSKLIVLEFPKDLPAITGTVRFYRANDKSKDLDIPIQIDQANVMEIPAEPFISGQWKVEVDWQAAQKGYFDRKILKMP